MVLFSYENFLQIFIFKHLKSGKFLFKIPVAREFSTPQNYYYLFLMGDAASMGLMSPCVGSESEQVNCVKKKVINLTAEQLAFARNSIQTHSSLYYF